MVPRRQRLGAVIAAVGIGRPSRAEGTRGAVRRCIVRVAVAAAATGCRVTAHGVRVIRQQLEMLRGKMRQVQPLD